MDYGYCCRKQELKQKINLQNKVDKIDQRSINKEANQ